MRGQIGDTVGLTAELDDLGSAAEALVVLAGAAEEDPEQRLKLPAMLRAISTQIAERLRTIARRLDEAGS